MNRNRLPWIVAAVSMLFAMIVLVRNEIVPGRNDAPVVQSTPMQQAVIRPANEEPVWRPSNHPPRDTPAAGDFSPWSQENPAPTPTPTPAPTPTPTPTPRPQYAFKGIVLDGNKPVKDALVRVISGDDNPAERSAVTQKDGHFSVTGIPDDRLDKIIVEAQGYSVTMLENVPFPLSEEMQIGLNPLAGIDAVILDFSTTSAEPILFNGEMQASLMRLHPAGEPSTNSLGISEPVLPVDSYLPVRDQHVVIREGELRFDNVEPGRYRIAVKSGNKVAESEALTVEENARSSASLVLGMKHTVKGNVVGADTGQAVAQARVSLSPYDSAPAGPEFPNYLSFTDGNGEFVIPEVQPGRYWMSVGAQAYTTKTLEGFTVLPGAAPENTSVTLSKQEPLITVAVTADDGRPMVGAPLVLMTAGAESPRTYFGKTDEAGLYRFDKLLSGRYTLAITAPGERTRQKSVHIDLGEGEVREMRVHFGTPTKVKGIAKVGGKAYKGVLSFVARGVAVADSLATTDAEGSYTAELEPGDYMVGTPDKPASVSITVTPTEAQTINLDIP